MVSWTSVLEILVFGFPILRGYHDRSYKMSINAHAYKMSSAQNPHPYKRHNAFTKTTGNGNDPTTKWNNKPTTENETQ
jgi:hypothetical protein